MERQSAEAIRDLALSAISDLARMLAAGEKHCAAAELDALRRAGGGIIGRIQTDILDGIYRQHPELSDLV